VIARVLVSTGWLVALLALAGVAKLSGQALDLYIHDRYFVVSKPHVILVILLIFVLPLVALSIRVFR